MAGAGEVLQQRIERERSSTTAVIGMIAFLASWAMMFSGLFFAFGLSRVRAEQWPPASVPALPLGLPSLNTLVIALSSVALLFGLSRVKRGHARALAPALYLATALGALFVVLQFKLWTDMWSAGLHASSGQYGSLFYALTWVHAVHVGVGILALLWLSIRASAGAFSPARHLSVKLWSFYWHFVGVAWLFMFLLVFLT